MNQNHAIQNYAAGNIGLSASAESVHQKRPSRRGNISRHHPNRSSSRRNKENGSTHSGSFRNSNKALGKHGNQMNVSRRPRAVSFDQPTLPIDLTAVIVPQMQKLCDRNDQHVATNDVTVDDEAVDGHNITKYDDCGGGGGGRAGAGIIPFDVLDVGWNNQFDAIVNGPRLL